MILFDPRALELQRAEVVEASRQPDAPLGGFGIGGDKIDLCSDRRLLFRLNFSGPLRFRMLARHGTALRMAAQSLL